MITCNWQCQLYRTAGRLTIVLSAALHTVIMSTVTQPTAYRGCLWGDAFLTSAPDEGKCHHGRLPPTPTATPDRVTDTNYRVFNLKVDRQLGREYFTSDAIYNGSAGMTLYCYMCRSWQDCCRRGEKRSWPTVSVESVDS